MSDTVYVSTLRYGDFNHSTFSMFMFFSLDKIILIRSALCLIARYYKTVRVHI